MCNSHPEATVVVLAIIFYLYGALPYAYLATRLFKGKNIRTEGTGNIGVTNAFKAGGYASGAVTVAGEISKAVFPVVCAGLLFPGSSVPVFLFVFFSLFGTSFSVFMKGRGGRGTTVAVWSLLLISPAACAVLLLLWALCLKFARYHKRIKTIPLYLLPFILYAVEGTAQFFIFGSAVGLLMCLNAHVKDDDFSYYGIFRKYIHSGKSDMSGFR